MITNIFLHYGFDTWMSREYPGVQFERFADDVVVHCVTERQARQVREAIGRRLVDIGLELHPDKTKIVYCKDSRQRQEYEQGDVHVLRVCVPSPEGLRQEEEADVRRLPTCCGPGEADRYEPQGSVLADPSTHHSDPE